jgi:hypothetical protein
MGTITGISDLDAVRWPNSHWRSVKVYFQGTFMFCSLQSSLYKNIAGCLPIYHLVRQDEDSYRDCLLFIGTNFVV